MHKTRFYTWNLISEQLLLLMQDRIAALKVAQEEREEMAELIELNNDLVDKALLVIRSAIANQVILSCYPKIHFQTFKEILKN